MTTYINQTNQTEKEEDNETDNRVDKINRVYNIDKMDKETSSKMLGEEMVDRYNAEPDRSYLKYKLDKNGDCVMYEDYQELKSEITELENTIIGLKNVLSVLSETNNKLQFKLEQTGGNKKK